MDEPYWPDIDERGGYSGPLTPNDNSPWRCPECSQLSKDCICEAMDQDGEWMDRFIENDYEDCP